MYEVEIDDGNLVEQVLFKAVALYDFSGEIVEEDLTFKAGNIIRVGRELVARLAMRSRWYISMQLR